MTRKWIEHDGSCIPVPVGTIVDALRRNGSVRLRFPAASSMIFGSGRTLDCIPVNPCGTTWIWDGVLQHLDIIAYRLSEDPSAETETRAHRENLWKDWLKSAEHLADPLPALPVKVR